MLVFLEFDKSRLRIYRILIALNHRKKTAVFTEKNPVVKLPVSRVKNPRVSSVKIQLLNCLYVE